MRLWWQDVDSFRAFNSLYLTHYYGGKILNLYRLFKLLVINTSSKTWTFWSVRQACLKVWCFWLEVLFYPINNRPNNECICSINLQSYFLSTYKYFHLNFELIHTYIISHTWLLNLITYLIWMVTKEWRGIMHSLIFINFFYIS